MDLELDGKAVVICGGATRDRARLRRGVRAGGRSGRDPRLGRGRRSLTPQPRSAPLGAEVITQQVDVSDGASVDAAHARAIETFGGIDVGFNNAGIITPSKAIEDTTRGGLGLGDRRQPQGRLALCPGPGPPHATARPGCDHQHRLGGVARRRARDDPYTAAKHGMLGITRTVALELATTGVQDQLRSRQEPSRPR